MKQHFFHNYIIKYRSNIIQRDSFGAPLRLCLVECPICGQSDQKWMDSCSFNDDVELRWYSNNHFNIDFTDIMIPEEKTV